MKLVEKPGKVEGRGRAELGEGEREGNEGRILIGVLELCAHGHDCGWGVCSEFCLYKVARE